MNAVIDSLVDNNTKYVCVYQMYRNNTIYIYIGFHKHFCSAYYELFEK